MKPIIHHNKLKTFEKKVVSHLAQFKEAIESENSEENKKFLKNIYCSLKKCLRMKPIERPDFIELAQELIKKSISKENIRFFISVQEKSEKDLQEIDWKAENKKDKLMAREEYIKTLEYDLNKSEKENKKLKEDINTLKETLMISEKKLKKYV